MKKKVLIYAHYYTPDVASTGQIIQDLAEGISDEFYVTVICTVPSYYGSISEGYREDRFYCESINRVTVIRVPVPAFNKTSKKSRVLNILSYYIKARRATRMVGSQDYVFAVSQPPILGGMLGVYGKRVLKTEKGKKPKFIYNIQDFNPEQIQAVGYIKFKPLIEIAMFLDKRTCLKADLVITVGRDLAETLINRFSGTKVPRYEIINNWIDEDIIYPLSHGDPGVIAFRKEYGLINKFVFMYSGNIGLYYDLEGFFTVIEKFKGAKTSEGKEVVFAFVGSGALLDKLTKYRDDHNMENVVFIPYQNKDKLIYSLNAADVHLCLSAKGIKGISVPSKIYGILATEKPVLSVAEKGSETEKLVVDTKSGKITEPNNYSSIEEGIKWFIKNSSELNYYEKGMNGFDFRRLNKRTGISMYRSLLQNL